MRGQNSGVAQLVERKTVNFEGVGSSPAAGVVPSYGLRATNDTVIEQFINDPLYKVRRDGTVFTKKGWHGRVAKTWRKQEPYTAKGYPTIKYNGKHLLVHRLVYRALVGPLHQDMVVDHIDNDRTNNKPSNLQLLTNAGNTKKAWSNPHNPRKKPIYNNKITQIIAGAIRSDRKRGMTYEELSDKYDLSKSNISYIVNKKTWV